MFRLLESPLSPHPSGSARFVYAPTRDFPQKNCISRKRQIEGCAVLRIICVFRKGFPDQESLRHLEKIFLENWVEDEARSDRSSNLVAVCFRAVCPLGSIGTPSANLSHIPYRPSGG